MIKDMVPENMTLEEASDFWDKHSFLDYDDIQETHFSVDLRKNKNYVSINDDLAKRIWVIARQKGISPHVLVNQWLKEKMVSEGDNP